MINHLAAKLEKVARESSDPKVRAAAARDAKGYRAVLETRLFLQYGGKRHPVASAKEAGDVWNAITLEAMRQGLGPDDMSGKPLLVDGNGKRLGYLSWNGRAWKKEGVPFDAEAKRSLDALHASLENKDA